MPPRYQTPEFAGSPRYARAQGLWLRLSQETIERRSQCKLYMLQVLSGTWAHFWCHRLHAINWCLVCWLCYRRALTGSAPVPWWLRRRSTRRNYQSLGHTHPWPDLSYEPELLGVPIPNNQSQRLEEGIRGIETEDESTLHVGYRPHQLIVEV